MPEAVQYIIESISEAHDVSGFDCGEKSLNDYLKLHALENHQRSLGITYVALDSSTRRVIGYYTLSSAQVERSTVPRRITRHLPGYPIPAIRIGRLAVDLSMKGRHLGSTILIDALRTSNGISTEVGAFLVIVDALSDAARDFYQKLGFEELLDNTHHLFLPMKKIKAMITIVG